jgi:dienelactone hydrolase
LFIFINFNREFAVVGVLLLLVHASTVDRLKARKETCQSTRRMKDICKWLFERTHAMLFGLVLLAVISSSAQAFFIPRDEEQYGPYKVAKVDYLLRGILDKSFPSSVVVFPKQILKPGNNETFPLVVFSHGDFGGGIVTYLGHKALLTGVASFGFIVLAPRSCSFEWQCSDDEYVEEQLQLLEWADSDDRIQDFLGVLKSVDRSAGYGVFGHSSGGRAVVQASPQFAEYNVKAAVLLHPGEVNTNFSITVPLASFTGTLDKCCGEDTTRPIYEQAVPPKAYANLIGGRHTEPVLFHTRWTIYIAAWFKLFLGAESADDTERYYNLMFGDTPNSLCGGSIPMKEDCEAIEARRRSRASTRRSHFRISNPN